MAPPKHTDLLQSYASNLSRSKKWRTNDYDETWRRLRALGCDVAQGWLIGRPLPAADFANWLNRGGFMPPAARWSA